MSCNMSARAARVDFSTSVRSSTASSTRRPSSRALLGGEALQDALALEDDLVEAPDEAQALGGGSRAFDAVLEEAAFLAQRLEHLELRLVRRDVERAEPGREHDEHRDGDAILAQAHLLAQDELRRREQTAPRLRLAAAVDPDAHGGSAPPELDDVA